MATNAEYDGHRDENGITRCMPESVVDGVEAVEIETEHNEF